MKRSIEGAYQSKRAPDDVDRSNDEAERSDGKAKPEQRFIDDNAEEEVEEEEVPSPVQCWDDAVTVTDALIRDVQTLWECYGGDKAQAKSFWVDADYAEPTTTIEATALQMADFHLQGAEYAGVEIWTQVRAASNPGLEFHFDKDEEAAAKENTWKHPVVGTATYLSTGGAPLVVFATASAETDEVDSTVQETDGLVEDDAKAPMKEETLKKKAKTDKDSVSDGKATCNDANQGDEACEVDNSKQNPSHAWICYPAKGRHVAFAGNFLHGVSQELLFDRHHSERLSLLVNIWLDHKPAAVQPLRDDVAKQLNRLTEGVFALEDVAERRTKPTETIELEATTPLLTLKEHVPGDTAPLPAKAIQSEVEKKGVTPLIQISFEQ